MLENFFCFLVKMFEETKYFHVHFYVISLCPSQSRRKMVDLKNIFDKYLE